ncbi:alpha-galactosidase [Microbacterium sp. zg.Y1084]|uniref:alpha-galactosidase n=1 Tax=Microbacterium sp. zg.Y1084 TaxID=2969667 RepID=UPI00214C2295|nr:alpha-galactosidase [Microbacterium sp. zg.Y1084]MCR2813862.1 alpha-galactosidase [Microbacterium sp. zg.Y1084]
MPDTAAAVSSAPLASAASEVIHLRRGGTSVVVDLGAESPAIVHWGEDLGDAPVATLQSLARAARLQRVSGGLDSTARLGVLTTAAAGWLGTPALEGHRDGQSVSARFTLADARATAHELRLDFADDETELSARVELSLGVSGLVRSRIAVRNEADAPYTVQALHATLPLPWDATEIFDTTGRHLRERSGQRHDLTFGTHLRETRRGRPGADATLLLAAGTPGFGFERGRVHGIHLAWSGNQRAFAERAPTGESFLGAGELYAPGEIRLGRGEEIVSPVLFGSWGDGLDALAARFHDEWRARPQHPRRPRPITLNTWEAVYFDHSLPKLTALADAAAALGVERYVLDDGWFRARRDDTAGLGDWFVDTGVWPDGLHPIVDHVRGLGMEFGLWFEPEMVNPDSDLARQHPDWLLRGRVELPPSARQQQVLNLAHPEAYAYIAGVIGAILDEYPIAYVKWDHNRDLVDAAAGPGGAAQVHAHTLAVYRLIDELKAARPGLEIESCASGGARVDLGILDRTDRIWTSDCLDPVERLENQRNTGLVVPPEMMGMHLTTPHVHSTGRTVALSMSGAVALFGHFGIEWDVTTLTEPDAAAVAEWVALAKRVRPLVAAGRVVNVDVADPGLDVRGVVAADAACAFFTVTQTQSLISSPTGRVRMPGLDPDRTYRVRIVTPGGIVQEPAQSPLDWAHHDTVLTGRQLALVGVRPPVQNPQQATVVEITAA